jgi:purine-binding chemotaxis protein CheW
MGERIDGSATQVLSLEVAGTEYGIPVAAVREILPYAPPVGVPGMPPSIRGIVEVRGAAVPVIDLSIKLGRGPTEPSERARVLVVEPVVAGARIALGLLVDAVSGVLVLPPDRIAPPPSFGASVRLDFLTGVGRAAGRSLPLLDVDRVVSASEADLAAQSALVREAQDAERRALASAPPIARA